MTFREFKLDDPLIEGLESMGYRQPTPIQEEAIPIIIEGNDLIGCAQTGTGKTAAFLLPVMQYILQLGQKGVQALVIVPTRELAVQIDQQVEGLGYFANITSLAIYGGKDGVSFAQEKQALLEGSDIVIATPGRLIAHLNLGYVRFDSLHFLVLDEADRMLDMGFSEDIDRIVASLPQDRTNLLFSATMPSGIRKLARNLLTNPKEVTIALSKPAEGVVQAAFSVYEAQKVPLLEHLLTARKMNSVIIFCSTKKSVNDVLKNLKKRNLEVGSISSDLDQQSREQMLNKFKNGKIKILVATNIVARGIDIEGIELVINYDVPRDAEDYVHRIGRTARASSKGIAFTLIAEQEQADFQQIEELIGNPVKKIPLPKPLGSAPLYRPYKKTGYRMKGRHKRKK